MSLRIKTILVVAIISLIYTGLLIGFMFYLTTTALNLWENKAIEQGLQIGVNNAPSPLEQVQAERAFKTYRQLKGLKGLFEWQIVGFGVLLGSILFVISLIISSFFLFRATKPLKELTMALSKAGEGDLDIKIAAPRSEIGQVINAYNKMTVQLKRSREDLKRAERIAAWRDVARVLAHEVRNPLTPIRLSVERLIERYKIKAKDFPEILERSSQVILSEISALERLVREFSNFARLPSPALKPTNINLLIDNVVTGCEAYGEQVKIKREMDESIVETQLDGELLKQVFSNIVKNSLDAFEGKKGEIIITTKREKKGIVIEFKDNGRGIQPDMIDKVFEPYFTTKAKGTGLGLAVVKQIISEHGGEVAIESELGKGTKLIIILPHQI